MTVAVAWRGLDEWRAEFAEVALDADGLSASGTQLGAAPYRADYEVVTGPDWVTERLTLDVRDAGGRRRLVLVRAADGTWAANGDPLPELDGALDCDLAFSPLTNAMPVARAGILAGGDARDFTMAWVSLPDLAVTSSRQRYEPIDSTHARFRSLDGDFEGFTAELEYDADGLVTLYPELAERVR